MTARAPEALSVLDLTRDRLLGYVRSARLPMLLVALPNGRTLELSESMASMIGRSREEALQTDSPDFTDNPAATRASLQMLSDGTLDGYTRRVRMPLPSGPGFELQVRVDACDNRGPNRLAVVTVLAPDDNPTLTQFPTSDAGRFSEGVTGTMSAEGVIDRIVDYDAQPGSVSTGSILQRKLLDLVHPEEAGAVTMLAAHASARASAVTGRTRMRGPRGGWQYARIALQPLARSSDTPDGPPGFAFALSPEPAATSALPGSVEGVQAAAERNQLQLRAASAAAHVTLVAAVTKSPELAVLSEREREVVVRILRGQRVPAIARELYLSQSTVRNHLTGVYRKLGVGSQAELVERLHPALRPL